MSDAAEVIARGLDPVAWDDSNGLRDCRTFENWRKRSLLRSRAAISALTKAGLAIRSIEPTEEQLVAGSDAIHILIGVRNVRRIYKAMIRSGK